MTLNVDYIQEKIHEGFPSTKQAKDKKLVIIIGNAGVGKSTTANYLLGCPMKKGQDQDGTPIIETVGKSIFNIGHGGTSETLYAKPVPSNLLSWVITDCPGFLGNRSVEDSIIESISTELTIRSASEIKGLVVVISINHLLETRLLDLQGLMKTLVALLKDPVSMVPFSTFVVTKKHPYMPENEARQSTVGAINRLMRHCLEQAKRLESLGKSSLSTEGLSSIEYNTIHKYFEAVLAKKDDIVFVDPLDNGESRQLIINKIDGIEPRKSVLKQFGSAMISGAKTVAKTVVSPFMDVDEVNVVRDVLQPITIDDFKFSEHDENRVKFNRAVYDLSVAGSTLMREVGNHCKEINEAQIAVEDAMKMLDALRKLESSLSSDKVFSKKDGAEIQKVIKVQEAIVKENISKIAQIQTKGAKLDKEVETLEIELREINNDNPLIFIEDSIDESVGFLNIFGWRELKFSADTGDDSVPIIQVDKSMENGKWKEEKDEKTQGKYRITYQSEFRARPAKASIKTYIKTKDEAGNKERIKQILEQLVKIKQEKANLLVEKEKLTERNAILQSDITLANAGLLNKKEEREQKLQDCRMQIADYQKSIETNRKLIETKKIEGVDWLQKFYEYQPKLTTLESISNLLKFPSTLVKGTVEKYRAFLVSLEKYRNLLTGDGMQANEVPMELDDRSPAARYYMLDPISGIPIKHPVKTTAGTWFDLPSLVEQFGEDQSKPFIYTHKDGHVEIIHFSAWQTDYEIRNLLKRTAASSISEHSDEAENKLFRLDNLSEEGLAEMGQELSTEIELLQAKLKEKEAVLDRVNHRISSIKDVKSNTSSPALPPQPPASADLASFYS